MCSSNISPSSTSRRDPSPAVRLPSPISHVGPAFSLAVMVTRGGDATQCAVKIRCCSYDFLSIASPKSHASDASHSELTRTMWEVSNGELDNFAQRTECPTRATSLGLKAFVTEDHTWQRRHISRLYHGYVGALRDLDHDLHSSASTCPIRSARMAPQTCSLTSAAAQGKRKE